MEVKFGFGVMACIAYLTYFTLNTILRQYQANQRIHACIANQAYTFIQILHLAKCVRQRFLFVSLFRIHNCNRQQQQQHRHRHRFRRLHIQFLTCVNECIHFNGNVPVFQWQPQNLRLKLFMKICAHFGGNDSMC